MHSTDLATHVRARLDRDIAEAERRLADIMERSEHVFDEYNVALTALVKARTEYAQRKAEADCNRAKNRLIDLIEPRVRAQKVLAALRRPETYEARLEEARDRGGGGGVSTTVALVGGPFAGVDVPVRGLCEPLVLTGDPVPEGMVARYRPTRTRGVFRFRGYDRIVATLPAPGAPTGDDS